MRNMINIRSDKNKNNKKRKKKKNKNKNKSVASSFAPSTPYLVAWV
jgi:hypothetical protein